MLEGDQVALFYLCITNWPPPTRLNGLGGSVLEQPPRPTGHAMPMRDWWCHASPRSTGSVVVSIVVILGGVLEANLPRNQTLLNMHNILEMFRTAKYHSKIKAGIIYILNKSILIFVLFKYLPEKKIVYFAQSYLYLQIQLFLKRHRILLPVYCLHLALSRAWVIQVASMHGAILWFWVTSCRGVVHVIETHWYMYQV